MPATLWHTGLEHGTLSQTGGGLFDTVSGGGTTATLVAGLKGGNFALQLSPTATVAARVEKAIAASTSITYRCHFKPVTLATSGLSSILSFSLVTSANKPLLRIGASADVGVSAVLQYAANGSSGFLNGPTLLAGVVYLLEVQLDVSTGTHALRIRVNGVTYADSTATVAADTCNRVRVGTTSVTGPAFTAVYDDLIVGSGVDAFYGEGRGYGFTPVLSPGHVLGTNGFRYTLNNATAYTTIASAAEVASAGAIDEWPITADGNAADDWVEINTGASTTDHLSYFVRKFPLLTAPNGVTPIVAIRANATGGTENFDLRLASGATEAATKIFTGAIGATTTNYKSQTYALAPSGVAWTDRLARGVNVRFYGQPGTQIPRLKAVMVEVDAPYDTNCKLAMNDHPNSQTYYGAAGNAARTTLFDKFAAAGVTEIRADFRWDLSEPLTKGTYDTAYTARIAETLSLAAARGITILANTLGTPSWARGGAGGTGTPPTDLTDYADWLAHMVATYPEIHTWEVWNEQNGGTAFWTGSQATYIAMLQEAYAAARVANPQALVINGGTIQCDPTWWTAAYSLGIKGSTDAVNLHPYGTHADIAPEDRTTVADEYFSDPPLIRAIQSTNADLDTPMVLTEWGYSTHPDANSDNGFGLPLCPADNTNETQGVSLTTQADYLTRGVAYARATYLENGVPYVRAMYWYLFHNKPSSGAGTPTDRCSHTDNRGVFWLDWSPKASAYAAGLPGHVLAITAAVTTDVAQAFTRRKLRLAGVTTTTDASQAVARRKLRAGGISTEADVAQTLVALKRRGSTPALETDAGQAVARRKLRLAGIGAEVDSALALARRKTAAVGVTTETDSALALARAHKRTAGVATETDLARILGVSRALTAAVESDLARAVVASGLRFVTAALETDAAQTLVRLKKRALPLLTTETDLAPAVARLKKDLLGVVVESDLAVSLVNRRVVPITVALEAGLAPPVARRKLRSSGLAAELDVALLFRALSRTSIAAAVESDAARLLAEVKRRPAGTAAETDLALALARRKVRLAGIASEVDAAFAELRTKRSRMGVAADSEEAVTVARFGVNRILTPGEIDVALAFVRRKTRALGRALTTDSAPAVSLARGYRITAATETDAARLVLLLRRYRLAEALELSDAQALAALKRLMIGAPLEHDEAVVVGKIGGHDVRTEHFPESGSGSVDLVLPGGVR